MIVRIDLNVGPARGWLDFDLEDRSSFDGKLVAKHVPNEAIARRFDELLTNPEEQFKLSGGAQLPDRVDGNWATLNQALDQLYTEFEAAGFSYNPVVLRPQTSQGDSFA